jgi:threonine/homoserine/homoserine lactone efflux protein
VNALGVLRAAGLGAGLGVVTSMTPAVINVSIVDAAAAGRRRFAIGLAVGGGAADAIQAGLAFAGVGRVVLADPRLVRVLAIAAALAIVAFAAITWRRRRDPAKRDGAAPAAAIAPDGADRPAGDRRQIGRGAATGFALTLLNPAVLGAWVTVAAAAWPGAELAEAAVIAGGVGTGSILWFALLARWISRLRRDHPAIAAIPRLAMIALLAIAAIGVVRAFY